MTSWWQDQTGHAEISMPPRVAIFPTNNLGELQYTGCAFKRGCELRAIEIAQKALTESTLNRLA